MSRAAQTAAIRATPALLCVASLSSGGASRRSRCSCSCWLSSTTSSRRASRSSTTSSTGRSPQARASSSWASAGPADRASPGSPRKCPSFSTARFSIWRTTTFRALEWSFSLMNAVKMTFQVFTLVKFRIANCTFILLFTFMNSFKMCPH